MRNTLYAALVIGALLAVFLIGKKKNWWSKLGPEVAEEKEPTSDPEPGEGPTPPPPITTTNTGGTGTKPKTVPRNKKVALNPSKPKPAASFNASNEAWTLANLLSDWTDLSGKDVQAFNKILAYSENELRSVHNAWLDKYPNGILISGIKSTLREQIKAEAVWNNRTDAVNKKAQVIQKLDNLNIP